MEGKKSRKIKKSEKDKSDELLIDVLINAYKAGSISLEGVCPHCYKSKECSATDSATNASSTAAVTTTPYLIVTTASTIDRIELNPCLT